MSGEKLLTFEELSAKLALKRTSIYQLIKRGEFPQPVKIGSASRWPQSEADQWIEQRRAARAVR